MESDVNFANNTSVTRWEAGQYERSATKLSFHVVSHEKPLKMKKKEVFSCYLPSNFNINLRWGTTSIISCSAVFIGCAGYLSIKQLDALDVISHSGQFNRLRLCWYPQHCRFVRSSLYWHVEQVSRRPSDHQRLQCEQPLLISIISTSYHWSTTLFQSDAPTPQIIIEAA